MQRAGPGERAALTAHRAGLGSAATKRPHVVGLLHRAPGLTKPSRRVWWAPWKPVIPEYLQLFVGLEGFAASEFVYVPSIVPGLLQTATRGWGAATRG